MALSAGTQLGRHKTLGLLGVGGMGEVYRAHDTRLGRDVALKVLPEAFAQDAERMARFEREAKVLASLNHPHIAAIYGLEEDGGVRALVMELVEGPTLAGAIESRLPLEEALGIARQISEALEYAHERGVIHRDLKPANLKLTSEGNIKILDFGLAKALSGDAASGEPDTSPTLTAMATRTGILLGTAAYMAPEQAKGKTVDRRADIWAFGVVLFEMLTGHRLFAGETASDVLAEVLKTEPNWSQLPPETPPRIRELLARCLVKDPKRRLQSMGDARIAVEEALSGQAPPDATLVPAAAPPDSAASWRRLLPWAIAAALAVALAVALAAYLGRSPQPAPALRVSILPPKDYHLRAQVFAVSPDGKELVFIVYSQADHSDRLWVRPLDSLDAHPLAGTENAYSPFWSPDSKSIAFFANEKLKKVDVSGGPVITLADAPVARGGSWSKDGNIVFAPKLGGHGLVEVSASGGAVTALNDLTPSLGHDNHRWPFFLPDGKHLLLFAFARTEARGDAVNQGRGIYIFDLGSGKLAFLRKADSQAQYSDGYLLFVEEGNLMAQPFDPSSRTLSGEAVAIASGARISANFAFGSFSAGNNGMLAYAGEAIASSSLQWFTRDGKEAGTLGAPARFSVVSLSPDGNRVATAVDENPGPRRDIWIYDSVRGTATRLTSDAMQASYPVWSRDGSRICYYDSGPAGVGIYSISSSGLGAAEFIQPLQGESATVSWSPDGKALLYMNYRAGPPQLWIHQFAPEKKDYALPLSNYESAEGQFSPDGRWLAYESEASGQPQVYVADFPNFTQRWQISTAGGAQPRWRGDGKELYYIAPDSNLMAVPVETAGAQFRALIPKALFATKIIGVAYNFLQYDVAADGKKFLINTQLGQPNQSITLFANWKSALAKQ